MKIRTLTFLLLISLTAAAFAEEDRRRVVRTPRSADTETIIIRDGKVVTRNGEPFELFVGKRAFLGVVLIDLTKDLREHYGAAKDAGALVGSVEEGSPAAKAGIRVGDLVVAVDGKDVDSSADLRAALRDKKDGDSVRVDVLRGRSRQTLVATLVEKEPVMTRFRTEDVQRLPEFFRSPEWKARVEALPNCSELQTRIKELETRLKDLEKKLQK